MNSPFALPQGSAAHSAATQTRVITITKPANGQSYTVQLSHDGSVKLDLSQIANEKITIVKVPSDVPGAGEKAIIIFDNQAAITIDPFFFSGQWPLQLTIDTGTQHDLTVSDFASLFPVTTDTSIIPAGGEQAQQSGATFEPPSVDPISSGDPLPLLPPEELPNWVATTLLANQLLGNENENDFPTFGINPDVPLDEDFLSKANGAPFNGNQDLPSPSPGDDPGSFDFSGLLHYDFHDDGPAAVNPIVIDTVSLNALGLHSSGGAVVFDWNSTTFTLTGFVDNDGTPGLSAGDKTVITLVIDPATATGSGNDHAFTVTLSAPLDHGDPGTEDNITLPLNITITDGNGDPQSGLVNVVVDDDLPVLVNQAHAGGEVDEDGLNNSQSVGNADTGLPGETGPTPALAILTGTAGALNALVSFGADGPGDPAFFLKSAAPTDSGLLSQGGTVLIVSDGSILHGYVESGANTGFQAGQDRDVFTLTVGGDGSYTFTLIDQIDHPSLDGLAGDNTENLLTTSLDLSSYIAGQDGDQDPVDLAAGTFTLQIRDDIPVIEAREATETTVTDTQTVDYTLHAGNVDVRGIGQGGHDLLLTGVDLKENDDTVNTNSGKIGVGDGQSIDGFEVHGPNESGPEILTMNFVMNLDLNTDTFTSHDSFPSVKFSLDVAEAGPGDNPAVVFISATNHDDGANTDSFVGLTFKVNDVAVSATGVFDNGVLIGYVLDGVPDNATIEAIGTSNFNILQVGNYNNFEFENTAGGATTTLTDGNSFKVYGIETEVTTTTVVTETFNVSEDESAGVNTAADPNPADDVNAPAIGTDAYNVLFAPDAIGYAKSGESVLVTDNDFTALFTGSVGADEKPGGGGTWSFAVTDANGGSFNNADSGLTTLDGTHILLTTDATTGALIGTAGATEVFKVYVDSDGFVWISQYQAIHNDLAGSTDTTFDDIATVTVDGGLHIKGTLTDFDHDSTSVVSDVGLQVRFQDDGPLAVDDADTVVGMTATGNVIDGTNEVTPGVDHVGTDGATVTDVSSNNEPGNNTTVNAGVLTIVGEYGTLELHPNGDYTYTRSDGSPLTDNDVFTYTLTDGDGDTSTAELVISIDDKGVTVSDLTPEARGGDATVWEAGLADGSAGPDTTLTIQTGTFTIAAPDGLQSLKVGDTVMSESDLLGASGSPITIAGGPAYGTLEITGYDNNSGEVSYRFTLTDNTLTHTNTTADATPGDVGSADQVFANYDVIVTDADNDSNSASPAVLSIAVNDDGPDAVNDVAAATNEGVAVQVNVETNDTPGADGVDWSNPANNVTNTNAAHGAVVYNDDGTFTYTPNAGFDGNDSFTYTITDGDGDSDTATVSLTVNPVVSTPTIASDLTGDHLVIKEDNSGTVKFTATAGATDVITSVLISGLDFSHASYVINGVTVSGGVAVYTVDFSGNPGNTGEVTVEIKPHEDSDVDVNTLTAVATAKDADHAGAGDPGADSSSVSVPIVVDAVLDEYANVDQSLIGHGTEAITQQAVSLGLTLSLDNTTTGVPNSNFNSPSDEPFDTTQQDTVGPAETFAVTIKVTGDVADLQLSDNTLGTLTETATPGTWTLTATHDNLAAAVAAVQAIVSANFDGTISGTIQAVSTDNGTGGGDIEDSTLDNSVTDDANWSLTIDPSVGTPTVEVTAGLTNGDLLIKEDSNSTVTVKASVEAGSDDVLTGAVISGLVSGASYSIDGGAVFVSDGTDKTITLSGATDTFTIQVFPPEDSDVDLGTIHVKATAADGNNPAVTADATTDIPVVVDAVLDQYVDATSGTPVSQATAATAQTFSLGITAAAATAPFTFSGLGNADTDSSESTTATITLNAALPVGASLSLAAGATISLVPTADPLVYTLTGSITEVDTALPLLQVTVPASYIGTITGTVSTTSVEANTPDGTVPASGSEPDTTDNTYTDATSATFSVTTTNTVPEVLDDTSSLKVYEAALATGTDPSSPAETDTDTNGLQFKATGEDIASIKFVDPNSLPVGITAPELDNLFSGTPTWALSVDGRTLTLKVDGQDTLVLTLTGATSITAGSSDFVTVAATLEDNVLHQLPPSVLDVILSNVTVVATDSNGDSVFATASVNIVDDAPLIDSIQNAIVANTDGVAVGEIHVNYGADDANSTSPATVNVTTDAGAVTTNSGLVITGWDDLSGITETLSADGKMLTATIDATGANFYTLQLDDATNDYTLTYHARPVVNEAISFSGGGGGGATETIDAAAGDHTVTFNGAIYNTTTNTLEDLGNASTSDDLKPTGNGFGVGTGGGNGIDNNEGFFVTVSDNGTPTTADSLVFSLLRNGGGGSTHTAHLHWIAYDADGNVITGGSGFNAGSGDELITLADSAATYEFTINPPGEYAKLAVWFDQETGMNSIGITDFKLGTSVIPEDQPLHFDIAAVDGDGDISATSGLDVLLSGGAGPGYTLTGTAASEVLVGGAGDDTLTGGGGADTLSGKAGADIFKYDAFTEGMDHILDFNAAEGDTIDVLVSGFAGLNPADVGKTADQVTGLFDANTSGTEATTADARFHFDAATHTLYYDSDGNAPGGAASVALATFDNDATVQAQNVHLV